ncbi:MAG: WD40 repeat domain-containing protein [Pirellulaceae bacterium]
MTQAVTKIAYRPDGQMVLTASLDGSVRGFNPANGQQAFAANHGSPVQTLAISADGQRLASGGDDKIVKFWNAANGGQLAPTALPAVATAIRSVAFSADSVHLFVATADSPEVTMYDAASGAVEQRFAGREAAVARVLAVGGDRQLLLTWSLDNRVLRDEVLADRQLAGHSQPVTSLATVPRPKDQPDAARRILSGSSDGTLREWDLNTGQATRQLNHGAPITDVAVSGDGQRFASTSANNSAKLWNAANNQQLAEMRGDLRALAEVARITRDKTAATAKQQATNTALAEAEKNLPVRTDAAKKAADALAAANQEVTAKQAALKTVADGKAAAEKLAIEAAAVAQKAALAKAGADEQVAQATLAKNTATETLSKAQSAVQADPNNAGLAQAVTRAQAAVTAADEKLKTMTADQAAKMKAATDASAAAADAASKAVAMNKPFLDANTALQTAETAQNAAAQVAAIADRELAEATALVPSLKAEVTALDQRLAKLETELTAAQQAAQAAEQPLRAVAFSPDSRQLATGGDMGVVHTWDAETGKAVASCVGHVGPIVSLAFRDADTILTGSSDKSAGMWNLNPGWMLERTIGSIDDPATLINRVPALAFSPDGKLLATGGGEPSRTGELKVWNVADGKAVMSVPEAHTDAIFGVCFSPDSTRVASGGADKYVRMFDIATGEHRCIALRGHTNHVLGVNWRADGLRLASCGADNSLRIWNAENGDRVHIIENFGKQVSSVRFIGQSVNTISCSADKTTRMHNSDNAQNFRNFTGATDFLYSADASPDGQFVIAGGFDSVLRVWNGTNSQVIHELAPPSESTPSGETVATQ